MIDLQSINKEVTDNMGNLLDTSYFQELAEQDEHEPQYVDGVALSPGVEFIPDFISTEIDLDRDVPDYIAGDFDVDVDEDGPFITASFDDTDDDFDFDAYCEANPDFDAAINGHWEYA